MPAGTETRRFTGAVVERDYVTPALRRWRRRTDLFLVALAIGSLLLLLLELVRDDLIALDRRFLDVVNLVVLVAFACDYVVELVLARNRWSYVRHEWPSALIVVTQAIAVVSTLPAFGVFRVLRAGPVLRFAIVILRVIGTGGFTARDGKVVLRRHAAGVALWVSGFTFLTAAVLFSLAEGVGHGERTESFFDALWWSFGTITTAGYGELYPRTSAGRIVAGFTMIIGVSTFAVVTAKFASFLVWSREHEDDPTVAPTAAES